MRKLRPRVWFGASALFVLLFGGVYLTGVFAGGNDVAGACAAAGHPLDRVYREQHWQEPGQLFPLHDRCDAAFDLVPGWVDPALVLLATAAVACLAAGVVSLAARRAQETV